jgi:hypothetical protein
MAGVMFRIPLNAALAWGATITLVSGCSMKRLDLVDETQNVPGSEGTSEQHTNAESETSGSATSESSTSSGPRNSSNPEVSSSSLVSSDGTAPTSDETTSFSWDVSPGETSDFEGPQCSPEKPYFIQGECRECEYPPKPGQCPDGTTCEFFRYVCEAYCSSDRECQLRDVEPLPVCDRRYWSCRGCGGDYECDNGLYCIFGRCVPPQTDQ